MVVNVVGAQNQPRELLQQVIFFVAGAVGANHADSGGAVAGQHLLELRCDQLQCLLPSRRNEFAFVLDEWLLDAVAAVGEVEGVPPLDAEEVAIDAALVAVVAAHNLHAGVGAADAQRGLAAVSAMGADGADVLHLPRTRLVPISARGERADRADVDAHAALFALQMIFFIRRDNQAGTAILNAQRPDVHALAANPNAAIAQLSL